MRCRLALAALLTGLLVAAAPASALDTPATPERSKKGSKGKRKKCKAGKVTVKVNGRTLCQSPKAALPAPKAGDPREEAILEALTPDIAKAPDPKDRVPPPMERIYRKLGPQALPGLKQMVGTALVRLDGMAAARRGRPALASLSRPALASANSDSGGSFSQRFGNVTIDARLSIGLVGAEFVGKAEFGMTTDKGDGTTVRVATEMPLGLDKIGFRSSVCPTVEGKLDAKDGIGITVRTEVRSNQGKTLDQYFVTEVVDETEMQGIVADDAKLDTLEIRSIQKIVEYAGGSAFGGSRVDGTIVRNTVIDMRTGQYDPHVTLINVGVKLSGVLNLLSPFLRSQVAERLKKAADKDFAATVDFEIKKFRELEAGWNRPNTCAKLTFGKARESLTLEKGEGGDDSVRLDANAGGAPAKADWTITGQSNGAFTLKDHGSNPNGLHYEATNVGKGILVVGTFKAVSKAGVAEERWIQRTKEDEFGSITGSFGGEYTGETSIGVPSRQVWTGVASFEQVTSEGGPAGLYLLKSGSVTIEISGTEQSGITGCRQSGSAQGQPTGGWMTVTGTGPDSAPPYRYSIEIQMPFVPVKGTRHTCPEAAQKEGYEGSQFDAVPFWRLQRADEESDKGLSYAGSHNESLGASPFISTFEETWNLAVAGKP